MNLNAVTAAAELVEIINDATFTHAPESFQAIRAYRPIKDLDAINGLLVTVVPGPQETSLASRASDTHDLAVHVAIQKLMTDADDLDEVDAMCAFVEEMRLTLNRTDLATMGATWVGDELDPIYVWEHLRSLGVFTSVLVMRYRKATR